MYPVCTQGGLTRVSGLLCQEERSSSLRNPPSSSCDEGLPSSRKGIQAAARARVKAARSAPPEGGRRALTRAERRGTTRRRVGAHGQTADVSAASSEEPFELRAIMEIRARGANRCSTTLKARRVIGSAPRRSDRCAICDRARCSPPGKNEIDAVGITLFGAPPRRAAAASTRPTRCARACWPPRPPRRCVRAVAAW